MEAIQSQLEVVVEQLGMLNGAMDEANKKL